jgi:hypothetical protein
VLRLFPEFEWESRRSERFTSAQKLVERLSALGLQKMDPKRCFPERAGGLDATWTNVEVPRAVVDGFGRYGGVTIDAERLAAA